MKIIKKQKSWLRKSPETEKGIMPPCLMKAWTSTSRHPNQRPRNPKLQDLKGRLLTRKLWSSRSEMYVFSSEVFSVGGISASDMMSL